MAQQPLCHLLLLPEPTPQQGGYYIDKHIPSRVQCSITRAGQEVVVLFSNVVAAVGLYVVLAMSPECRETSPVVILRMCVIYQRAVTLFTYPKPDQNPSPQLTNPTCSIPIRDGFYIPFMKPSPKCPLVFLLVTRHSVPDIVIPFICDSQELHRTIKNFSTTTATQRVAVVIISTVDKLVPIRVLEHSTLHPVHSSILRHAAHHFSHSQIESSPIPIHPNAVLLSRFRSLVPTELTVAESILESCWAVVANFKNRGPSPPLIYLLTRYRLVQFPSLFHRHCFRPPRFRLLSNLQSNTYITIITTLNFSMTVNQYTKYIRAPTLL